MNRDDIPHGTVGRTAAYLLAGAVVALALTPIVVPLQRLVHDAV
jgi:hypothetical protein